MSPSTLNYHHLLYFWAVAKEGSLRRASEVLHVSQPSISAQLKQLEDSLGAALFTRTTRRLVLTDTGQTVLQYAEEIFSLDRELLTAVRQEPGQRPLPSARRCSRFGAENHRAPTAYLRLQTWPIGARDCPRSFPGRTHHAVGWAQAGCCPGRRTIHQRSARKDFQSAREHLGCSEHQTGLIKPLAQ